VSGSVNGRQLEVEAGCPRVLTVDALRQTRV